MTFTQQSCQAEKFNRVKLSGETVTGTIFEDCEFTGCSFIECRFEKCRFVRCRFSDCMLSAVAPRDSRLVEVSFSRCRVIGNDWTQATLAKELSFAGCQVTYSNFRFVRSPGIKLTDCDAGDTDFTEADLHGGDFRGSDFTNARFFKTDLSGVDFRGAHNYLIDVTNNSVKKARFSLPEAISLLGGLDIIIE